MNKRKIRLTEEQFYRIIKESVMAELSENHISDDSEKEQQMKNDWEEWESSSRKVPMRRPFDFRDFYKHQEMKNSLDFLNGETSRKAYINGDSEEEMAKRQLRYDNYKRYYGILPENYYIQFDTDFFS